MYSLLGDIQICDGQPVTLSEELKARNLIFNLEGPILARPLKRDRITKHGPHLNQNKDKLSELLRAENIALIGNNHILDYGTSGIYQTIEAAEESGLRLVGLNGLSQDNQIKLSHILRLDELGAALLCYTDTEFSVFPECEFSTVPYSYLRLKADLQRLKQQGLDPIVIVHAGVEHERIVNPSAYSFAAQALDLGAQLVIFNHSHTIGHKIGNIFFGTGNAVFDNNKCKHSLLIELSRKDGRLTADYKLIQNQKNHLSIGEETSVEQIENISEQKYMRMWQEIVERKGPHLASVFYEFPQFRFSRRLLPKVVRQICSTLGPKATKLDNALNCEAHRDILSQYFINSRKRY